MVETPSETDRDVVVVGGGPTGSSAAVFLARYGFETVVFDRGAGALPRAAYIENYPGFPGGIDVETLRALLHDHVEQTGATRVEALVDSVERVDEGFRVETADGRERTARYVLAAAWYDGSYLRGVCEEAAFELHDHHGETEERFAPEYPDVDGRTPVEGLYVAAPNGGRNAQVVVAAGQGAQVARSLIEDHRRDEGFPSLLATEYDWLRPESEFTGEWGDRDRWREWFTNEAGDHDLDEERFAELRERYIDRAFATRRSPEEITELTAAGHRRLADRLDDEALLDAVDNEAIRAYAADLDGEVAVDD